MLAVTWFDLVLFMARNKKMFTVIFSFHEQDLSSSLTKARYEVRCRLRNCHTLPFFLKLMPFRHPEMFFVSFISSLKL